MRIERLRIGLGLLNKVDGKEYRIVEVNGATGTAAEMSKDPETGMISIGDGKVTVTEKNVLAFRILNDPEPYPVPEGYSVRDGVLLKDGKPAVTQGKFSFIRILSTCPDCMLLAARLKGMEDGNIALVSYQVSRDLFRELAVVPENIIFLGYAGEGMEKAVFLFSTTEEKETEKDGEKKNMKCFKETALVIVEKGVSCNYRDLNIPVTVEDSFIERISGDKDGSFELFLASDEKEEDGVLVPCKERLWAIAPSWSLRHTRTFSCDGNIRAYRSPTYQDFVIRGKNMVRFNEFEVTDPTVAKLDGYDTLIDFTKEDEGRRIADITNNLFAQWDISITELSRDALANMQARSPAEIQNIFKVIADLAETTVEEVGAGSSDIDAPALYILTNKDSYMGAAVVLYPGVLESCAEKIGGGFLPAAKHYP